jgi:hypothetical protein
MKQQVRRDKVTRISSVVVLTKYCWASKKNKSYPIRGLGQALGVPGG